MIIAGPDKQSGRLSRVDDSVVKVARLALEFGRLERPIGQQERAADAVDVANRAQLLDLPESPKPHT